MAQFDTWIVLRRSGWRSPDDLREAAARSSAVGQGEMSDAVRWIRSYVMTEDDGTLGTVCVYQAADDAALRTHASRAFLPVDEIVRVADTVVVRPDPGAPNADEEGTR